MMNTLRKYARWYPIAVYVLTFAISAITTVWAVSTERATAVETRKSHTRQIDDHESRLRTVEKETTTIGEAVRWTRDAVARIEDRLDGGDP